MSRENISVENVISMSDLEREIDLSSLSDDIEELEYNTSVGRAAAIYEKSKNSTKVILYNTGVMMCMGGKSETESKKEIEKLLSTLKELEIDTTDCEIEIINKVYTYDFKQNLNLNSIAVAFGFENVEYEPEQFSGLIYKENNKVVIIFSSGKSVISGCETDEECFSIINKIENKLQSYNITETKTDT